MPSAISLRKKIQDITANDADEPDLYGYVRDLLVRPTFGIKAKDKQIVIDSKLDGSLRRPDLVVYRSFGGKALRGPDHAIAVFEVKKDNQVATAPLPILREKRAYVQSGTSWFFLIDQHVVSRVDVSNRQAFRRALDEFRNLSDEISCTWDWSALSEPETFTECFGVLSAEHLNLEAELERFRQNQTPFAFLDASGQERSQFGDTVREASELLRDAVQRIVTETAVRDLKSANELTASMAKDYGEASFDWTNAQRPVLFQKASDADAWKALGEQLAVDYEPRYRQFMADLEPSVYALRLEHELIQNYAERQGVSNASLESADGKLLQSLAYETGSLILSRMLTIRFCEDYDLFKTRYISNGGIEVFWNFAEHFKLPMQELLRQTYRHAREVFRSIFETNLLDWAVQRDDPVLSDALQRAAFILSRWDFKTVRGDILSGVYDRYLDVSQRRRLGEVYTRPEVARFMLDAAGWSATDRVLDPACGTGTFLVEALVQRLRQLDSMGAITPENVRSVLQKLHGLDLSSFSVALAQIQIFWHLIEVVKDKSVEEAREFARSILPSLPLYGGWSSLDPLGMTFAQGVAAGATAQSGFVFRLALDERRKAVIPPGFERAARGEYDLVVMNPPYIRSERAGRGGYGAIYEEVAYRNTDTSIYFIYRALRQWVKPGGRLAFIVPIGMSEASYAGPLRRVLEGCRIRLVADLEGLGKATFRGIKRATIIMVVERSTPHADDSVEVLQLGPSALVDDVIDFSKAMRTTVRRQQLDRSRYLPAGLRRVMASDRASGPVAATYDDVAHADTGEPGETDIPDAPPSVEPPAAEGQGAAATMPEPPAWMSAIRTNEDASDAILTKMAKGDPEALEAMAELPRLGDIVRVIWVKRERDAPTEVRDTPPGNTGHGFRPELLFNYGVKLGGPSALCQSAAEPGIDLYKGQNIFPQGLLGTPLGRWSPEARRETTRYIYSYADHLSYRDTYAVREIAQLPTAAPIREGTGFQNTAFVVELTESFPLNGYFLSRIVQFYVARVLRSSIIEDLGAHWYKSTLTLVPIPHQRSGSDLEALRVTGQAVMDADSDIADRYRKIDALIAAGTEAGKDINRLIVEGDPQIAGIELKQLSETPLLVQDIREVGDEILASDLFFRLVIPDEALRRYVAFTLARRVEQAPDAELSRDDVLTLKVPANLDAVLEEIELFSADNLDQRYSDALDELDRLVAQQCGVSDALRDHMVSAMRSDPILSQMRPMIAQRGLRVQLYADHSRGDRYV